MTVVFAPQEAPEIGDQPHHLAQRRWGFRVFNPVCDDPDGLPFLGIEHHIAGQIWAISAPGDPVQYPLGHDQVNHQGPFQPFQGAQLQRLNPAARFPNSKENFDQPAFSIPINQLNYILQSFRRPMGQQSPHQHRLTRRGCGSRARIAVTVTAGWPWWADSVTAWRYRAWRTGRAERPGAAGR